MSKKLIRITTVPISLRVLLKGQLRYMKENHFEVLCISSGGLDLKKVEDKEGVSVFAIEMSRVISPFRDLISLWKVYCLFRKERPLIVHSHTPKAGIIGMLGARIARVPIRMHTIAGMPLMESKGIKKFVLMWVEKITYLCATNIYPNSKGLYDFVLKVGLTKVEKLTLVGNGSSNGICTKHFSINAISNYEREDLKNRLGIEPKDFVFIYVGRLVGDKGINELIMAFTNLKISSIRLILVGAFESELDPIHKETIKEIESNEKIAAVGFQEDVRPYLAISDCLVFPSYREGFPNVVLQAGAMGLPSIVTDITGSNEIIIEGVNGRIVPSKNIDELNLAMIDMVNNVSKFLELKSNARSMIESRFEQSYFWSELLKEYKSLENYVC